MPSVALTVASAPARLSSLPAITPCVEAPEVAAVPVPLAAPALEPVPAATAPTRPRLRLVTSLTSQQVGVADSAGMPTPVAPEVVHGHGGPASCRCRACVMARHPSALPRLTVVR
ncbi:hypothetical protein I6A84_08995 [Frankia sp. CNm7]|uniref:Uncharacterized protein n=1 Tax=Frankia nepalensis TaxID=1836974 RepID=A0A937RFY7_9ACTN|nr:hypothetical protein [Frankia nepalensis]MBL7494929.1 hypothetical protein [Frankia nepalensis]MBL7515187.1 hypothetical protein [Frankia nepalensis]MBL7518244.1 hypothetical protein [Frankia nepalensis]MBL7629482.1 hypothetical protein [Frankia nepalensis]